jgi:hypothetical protein
VPQPFPLIGNLIGLPNGWARGLGSISTSGFTDCQSSSITFATGNTVQPTGNILLYLVTAEEMGRFTDGIDPDSTLSQDKLIGPSTQANLIQRLGGPTAANPLKVYTLYSFNSFSLKSLLGSRPGFWSPLVWNLSGGMLSTNITPYGVYTLQT